MPKPIPIEPQRTSGERGPEPFDLRFVLLALVARYLDSERDVRFAILRDLEDTLIGYWDKPYVEFRIAFIARPETAQFSDMRTWYRELRLLMSRAGFDGESDVRVKEAA